jgi:murein L,D-transpeptidase YcbB/YkuD
LRRLLVLGSLIALPLLSPIEAAAQEPLRLDLNIPALRLTVYEGDRAIRSYPVAVGMLAHATPTGYFDIDFAEWNPWWRPPDREWAREDKLTPPGPNNPMGRVKLIFEPLYFIHGTPESASIGTPASHGCVRMRNDDVVALARLLHERSAPRVVSQIDGILRSGRTRRVDFQTKIPLRVRYEPVEVAGGEIVVHPDLYRRNAVHTEGVYQALMAAGYDVSSVRMDDVRRLIERVSGHDRVYKVAVEDAFGRLAAVEAAATR